MIIKNLEVSEINFDNFDHKNKKITINIKFSNEEDPLKGSFTLSDDYDGFIKNILSWIKQQKTPNKVDDDRFLPGFVKVNVLNSEDILERGPKGLTRIDSAMYEFKHVNVAHDFMNAYAKLNSVQGVIFRK